MELGVEDAETLNGIDDVVVMRVLVAGRTSGGMKIDCCGRGCNAGDGTGGGGKLCGGADVMLAVDEEAPWNTRFGLSVVDNRRIRNSCSGTVKRPRISLNCIVCAVA